MIDERSQAEVALARLDARATQAESEWPPIARRIREARERLGLTEAEIADKLGLPASEYWDVEMHDDEAFTNFAVGHLGQLAVLLGLTVQEMLFGSIAREHPAPVSFAQIAELLAALASAEGITMDALSERIGWELRPVLRNPLALGDFTVVGLRDVCGAIGVDWVSALPEKIERTG